jgi:hypothetical protein
MAQIMRGQGSFNIQIPPSPNPGFCSDKAWFAGRPNFVGGGGGVLSSPFPQAMQQKWVKTLGLVTCVCAITLLGTFLAVSGRIFASGKLIYYFQKD